MTNYQHRNSNKLENCENTMLSMFCFDNVLNSIWNNPLKDIVSFQKFKFVTTPDFSIYSNMNPNDIRQNVYENRWIGATYQSFGLRVSPIIQWADQSTYKYCFGAVEEGTVVTISTLGCMQSKKDFLDGFNKMKEIIKPRVIIVYGDMIEGMTGKFINFKYEDAFVSTNKGTQLSLWNNNGIFSINEGGEIIWEAEELS